MGAERGGAGEDDSGAGAVAVEGQSEHGVEVGLEAVALLVGEHVFDGAHDVSKAGVVEGEPGPSGFFAEAGVEIFGVDGEAEFSCFEADEAGAEGALVAGGGEEVGEEEVLGVDPGGAAVGLFESGVVLGDVADIDLSAVIEAEVAAQLPEVVEAAGASSVGVAAAGDDAGFIGAEDIAAAFSGGDGEDEGEVGATGVIGEA